MSNLFPTLSNEALSQIKHSKLIIPPKKIVPSFITFISKTGVWTLEPDKETITDTRIIIDAASFIHGWILWRSNKVDSKVSVPHYDPLPEQIPGYTASDGKFVSSSELHGFLGFLGEEKLPVAFNTSSVGGRSLCDNLLTAIKARVEAGETEFIYPAIRLTVSKPYTCDYGRFHNPTCDLVRWVNNMGVMAAEIDEIDEIDEIEVLKERRQKK